MRTDGTFTPDVRGGLATDDGAKIFFAWQGYTRAGASGVHEIVGSITHLSEDDRYRWLNDRVFALTGEVKPTEGGVGFEVALDVAELVWEPLG